MSSGPCVLVSDMQPATSPDQKFIGFAFCTGSSPALTFALKNLCAGSERPVVHVYPHDCSTHCGVFAMAKSTGIAIKSAFYEFVGRNPEAVPFKQIGQNIC